MHKRSGSRVRELSIACSRAQSFNPGETQKLEQSVKFLLFSFQSQACNRSVNSSKVDCKTQEITDFGPEMMLDVFTGRSDCDAVRCRLARILISIERTLIAFVFGQIPLVLESGQ